MRQDEKAPVIDRDFNDAIRYYGEGRLSQAEEICQKILANDPDHPKSLSMLGVIAYAAGEADRAVELLSRAIAVKPDYAEAHSNLGNLFRDLGRLAEAEESYRLALDLKPKFANFHNNLGVTLTALGRLDDAVASCRQAITLNPDLAEAHNSLGSALHALGRLDEAIHSYHKALAIKPDFAEAHSNLGITLKELGRLDDAVASYQKALAIDPDFADTHNNLGNALKEVGQLDQAVASYCEAIAIKPDFAEAHINLGNTLPDLGRMEDAVASFRKALAIQPDNAKVHNTLGNALQDLGKLDEAVASYHNALALKPGFAEAQYSLGTLYKGLGQEEKAFAFFKEAGIRDSEEELLGCLYKSGKFEEFNEILQVISKKEPASALVSSLSAHASINLKQPDNYNFCGKPLDFAYQNRFECLFENDEKLLQSLLRDIRSDKKDSRTQPLLKFGEQSYGNLFNYPEPSFACLPDLIMAEIERYRAHFKGEQCWLISQWPPKTKLRGWYVRMQSGGHLDAHIHELGWVSGTIYLSLPENVSQDEGKIELGLHGNNYPLMHENFPTKTLPIKTGDIILFPASTFHRTIPFSSDEERICIAFDIIPEVNRT